jgi:hypothetical protein
MPSSIVKSIVFLSLCFELCLTAKIRLLDLLDDVSRRTDAPGQHEWWNFYAEDAENGYSISTIFLNGDMFNADYAVAFAAYQEDPINTPAPDPNNYQLLQINVALRHKKIFSTIKMPPQTVVEYSRERVYGRVSSPLSDSWFEAEGDRGERVYRVHISTPDMFNRLTFEADIEFRDASLGFTLAEGGLFGPIPGGNLSGIHFPIAKPVSKARFSIRNKRGDVIHQHAFQNGGGHVDHIFGEFYGTLCTQYLFGRLNLQDSDLMYWYHTPTQPSVGRYGWVLRIPQDGSVPWAYSIEALSETDLVQRPRYLEYYSTLDFSLGTAGAMTVKVELTEASEDWPFQVVGVGHYDVSIPGDLTVVADGIAELGYLPGILDPFFIFIFSLMDNIPWLPDVDFND